MASEEPSLSGSGNDRDTDPLLSAAVSELLLARAKEVARAIEGRVRQVLQPTIPLRVLCVDDHPDAADALAAVLVLLGYEARACYDGPSALAQVDEFCPDVCVLDLAMPGMDGMELAARLKARAGRQPLLLVAATARGSLEDRTLTALAGFHFHLVKPVDTPTLLAALTRFGEILARVKNTRERPGNLAEDPFPDPGS
jgi:CheY-like chemotaxis protein